MPEIHTPRAGSYSVELTRFNVSRGVTQPHTHTQEADCFLRQYRQVISTAQSVGTLSHAPWTFYCRVRPCIRLPCHHTDIQVISRASGCRFATSTSIRGFVSPSRGAASSESWRERAQAPSSLSGMSLRGAVFPPPQFPACDGAFPDVFPALSANRIGHPTAGGPSRQPAQLPSTPPR